MYINYCSNRKARVQFEWWSKQMQSDCTWSVTWCCKRRPLTLFLYHCPDQNMLLLFSRLVVSDSSWPHGPEHTRHSCLPLPPAVWSDSCWLASRTLSNLRLAPSIFPNIRVFSRESSLLMRWPKYWSLSFRICPSSEHSGLISWV